MLIIDWVFLFATTKKVGMIRVQTAGYHGLKYSYFPQGRALDFNAIIKS